MKFWSQIFICALLYIEYVQDYNSGCPATSGNNLTSKTGLKSLEYFLKYCRKISFKCADLTHLNNIAKCCKYYF